MRNCALVLALATVLALPAAAAAAPPHRTVYLNGVDLDGVELPVASFDHCTVSFDAKGNIHITAPGFEVHTKEEGSKTPAKPAKKKAVPAELSRHYFLVSRENHRGASGYDVTVYINGKRITTVRSNAGAAAIDVTKWVHPGDNQLRLLAAKRNNGDPKASKSKGDYLELQLAEGDTEKGQAVVRSTILTYRRTAAERASFQHTYTFQGR